MSDDIADLLVAEAEIVIPRDDASTLAIVRDLHYVPGPDPERPWRSGRAEYRSDEYVNGECFCGLPARECFTLMLLDGEFDVEVAQ